MLRALVVFVLLAAAAALPPPESQRPLKSDFLIQSLPNLTLPETYQQYAGHLTFNETFNQRFFFWYTEKDTSTPDTPESNSLTIWFNGGPGASAMYSFFSENIGIINIFNKKKIIEINKRSWNQYTNMLYIEYPLFVGYSSAEDHPDFQNLNVESSGKMMVQFLKKWLRIFSMERTKMFLIGQSFAGTYIPYIAKAIAESDDPVFNLRAVGLGSPWMDGFTQTVNYVDYLVEQKLFDRHNSTAIELIDKDVTKFHDYLRKNETVGVSVMSFFEDTVMKVVDSHLRDLGRLKLGYCVDIHDYRTHYRCKPEGRSVDLREEFMNDPLTRKSLHVLNLPPMTSIENNKTLIKPWKWEVSSERVFTTFESDPSVPPYKLVESLIDNGVKVLIYVGRYDIQINYKGLENMIQSMSWGGRKGFKSVDQRNWHRLRSADGDVVGLLHGERNLWFAKMNSGGHGLNARFQKGAESVLGRLLRL